MSNPLIQRWYLAIIGVLALALTVVLVTVTGLGLALPTSLGSLFFLAAWQFRSQQEHRATTEALETKLAETEGNLKTMAKAVANTRDQMEQITSKVDGKDQQVVAELKLLQTLLGQVVKKNLNIGSGTTARPAKKAAPVGPKTQSAPSPSALFQDTPTTDAESDTESDTESDDALELTMSDSIAADSPSDSATGPSSGTSSSQSVSKKQQAKTPKPTQPAKPKTPKGVIPGDTEYDTTVNPDAKPNTRENPSDTNSQDLDPAFEQAWEDIDDLEDDDDLVLESEALEQVPARTAGTRPPGRAQIRLIKRESQLLEVIQSALSENRVDLYLQSIVSMPSRKPAHYECFSRVRDEEGRIILPRHYMKVAEAKGLVGTIDNLLLFRLIQLVRKLGPRRPNLRFFINLSPHSIADPEFFPQFIDFMQTQEEFTNRLVFEISQSDYATLGDAVLDQLKRLARRGFQFSLDRVTTFDTEFISLKKARFAYIKADMKALSASHDNHAIKDMVAMLRRHDMALIGSRVETEEMLLEALEANVEYAQGYHFGEPRAAADINREL